MKYSLTIAACERDGHFNLNLNAPILNLQSVHYALKLSLSENLEQQVAKRNTFNSSESHPMFLLPLQPLAVQDTLQNPLLPTQLANNTPTPGNTTHYRTT